MTFGEQLKAHRKALHISQEALAERVGVSRQAVAKWEADQSLPSSKNLIALAGIFGLSLEQLMSASEDGAPVPGKLAQASSIKWAIILQAAALAALITPTDADLSPAWQGGFILFKLGLVFLCTVRMVKNLSFEPDSRQRVKNHLLEMLYCLLQAAVALLFGCTGHPFPGTLVLSAVCLGYIFCINPKYMNRVLVWSKKG